MSEKYDAVIIGTGIIGSPIGFELAKKGWKTLNIDTLPAGCLQISSAWPYGPNPVRKFNTAIHSARDSLSAANPRMTLFDHVGRMPP